MDSGEKTKKLNQEFLSSKLLQVKTLFPCEGG